MLTLVQALESLLFLKRSATSPQHFANVLPQSVVFVGFQLGKVNPKTVGGDPRYNCAIHTQRLLSLVEGQHQSDLPPYDLRHRSQNATSGFGEIPDETIGAIDKSAYLVGIGRMAIHWSPFPAPSTITGSWLLLHVVLLRFGSVNIPIV